MVDMPPLWKWCLAVIAGGGTAGTVKASMSGIRLGSTNTSGGLSNPVFATTEWLVSFALSWLGIFIPVLAVLVTLTIMLILFRLAFKIYASGAEPPLTEH
ncbi:MAG: DUF4126 domain-containing protein [Planctomycetaceae bacterium]|nr:DUF4126 domain-containing protein [Planctomycetaceae bacterium]